MRRASLPSLCALTVTHIRPNDATLPAINIYVGFIYNFIDNSGAGIMKDASSKAASPKLPATSIHHHHPGQLSLLATYDGFIYNFIGNGGLSTTKATSPRQPAISAHHHLSWQTPR
jgi:hypothetical protein